jgi:hypothetical protein
MPVFMINADDDYSSYDSATIALLAQSSLRTTASLQSLLTDILSGAAPLTYSGSYITTQVAYNSKLRPTGIIGSNTNIDEYKVLKISTVLSLSKIISLDEKNQVLTTNFYLLLQWNDPRLSWDPSSYGNTYVVTLPYSYFWVPDVAIMNAAGINTLISYPPNQYITLFFQGTSYLTLSLSSQQTKCSLYVYKYPFDSQSCSIQIGSLSYTFIDVKYVANTNKSSITNYVKNSVWTLDSVSINETLTSTRFSIYDDITDGVTIYGHDFVFTINISRQPLYTMIGGIFPNMILNIVILMAFTMPFNVQVGLCNLKYFHILQ